jgi:N-acyl-D-amino-acid deacylase
LKSHEAKKIIDAGGMNVVPGFVDLHTHYDAQLFWDPYCTMSSWHGITSLVIGNCGFGFAPVKPDLRERSMLTMTRTEAIPYVSMKAGLPRDWVTYPEFLDSVDRHPKGVNLLPFVPLAPVMTWTMGLEEAKSGRMPTEAETKEMCRILHEAMDHGACGWSAQRLGRKSVQADFDGTPMVTDIMHDETALALARVLGERNEGFIQMTYLPELGDLEGDPEAHAERHYEELALAAGRFYTTPWLSTMRIRSVFVINSNGSKAASGAVSAFWVKVPRWRLALRLPSGIGTCTTTCRRGTKPPPAQLRIGS